MKTKFFINFLWLSFFMIGGCGIEPGLSGKSRSEYLNTIKPYLEYWGKANMTSGSRRLDSWNCGTASTVYAADNVVFSDDAIFTEQSKDEANYQIARERLRVKWVECMKDKGYVWIKED